MGCHPVAVVIMHVHKYDERMYEELKQRWENMQLATPVYLEIPHPQNTVLKWKHFKNSNHWICVIITAILKHD